MLVLIAAAVEPGAADVLHGAWGIQAWLGWLFLMLFGSVVAYMICLRLPRHWGRLRREVMLFVSPVIAVLVGVVVMGE